MSICAPCQKLKPVSFCNDTGDEETNNFSGITSSEFEAGAINIYFKSLATGAIYVVEGLVYGCGEGGEGQEDVCSVIYEFVGSNFPLATDMGYEMWFNNVGDSIEDKVEVTIDGVTADCFLFTGVQVYNLDDEANEVYINQTLKVAD